MRLLFPGCLLLALLAGCESRQPAATGQPTATLAAPVAVVPAAKSSPLPDTADCTRAQASRWPGPTDTLIAIGAQHYWLSMHVATDSTRALYYNPAANAGAAFAVPGDTAGYAAGQVRGYHETYTFVLRDSTRKKLLFHRQLHKPDFYRAGSRDIVTVMNMERPCYLGYSTALDALVFNCALWIPNSDVGGRATLLLDRQGHLKTISPSGSLLWDAADCDPQLSPSGRAVLTCTELLRAGQPPLNLTKPHAQLQAVRFLNDSTLLVLYEYGDYQARPIEEVENDPSVTAPMTAAEFVATPAQRRLPTAVVLRTSGKVLRQCNLHTTGVAANQLPRTFLKPARTYFFFDETSRKLVLLLKAHPDSLRELPLQSLLAFKPPLHPHEQKIEINSDFSRLWLYVDTLRPWIVRYRLKAKMAG
jgi:hypothetical protein